MSSGVLLLMRRHSQGFTQCNGTRVLSWKQPNMVLHAQIKGHNKTSTEGSEISSHTENDLKIRKKMYLTGTLTTFTSGIDYKFYTSNTGTLCSHLIFNHCPLLPLYVCNLCPQPLDFLLLSSNLSTQHLLKRDQLLLLRQDLILLIIERTRRRLKVFLESCWSMCFYELLTCAKRRLMTSSSFSVISSLETSSFDRLAISWAILLSHS